MILKILENFALQLVFLLGFLVLFGLVIRYLEKALFKILGPKHGRRVYMTAGFIGVPVHELGHMIFCLLFWHKIKAVKLYQPNSSDGTLGYVQHTYNKKNTFQQIGNFFIGIGPILFGSAVILLFLLIFLPELTWVGVNSDILETLGALYAPVNFIDPLWWVFMILAASVCMHMSLSVSDLKGSAKGCIYIVLLVLVINFIVYLFSPKAIESITKWCMSAGLSVMSFLVLAVLILSVLVIFCFLVKTIFKKKHKLQYVKTPEPVKIPETDEAAGYAAEPMIMPRLNLNSDENSGTEQEKF